MTMTIIHLKSFLTYACIYNKQQKKNFFYSSLFQTMCTNMLIFSIELLSILFRLSLIFVFDNDDDEPTSSSSSSSFYKH